MKIKKRLKNIAIIKKLLYDISNINLWITSIEQNIRMENEYDEKEKYGDSILCNSCVDASCMW